MNTLISILLVILPALPVVAFLTLFERHVIATLQRRVGPNLVFISGGGQAVADALKLMMKELILPCIANSSFFGLAPFLTLLWSLMIWVIFPFGENQIICDLDLSILFNYAVTSLGSYGIILSGWEGYCSYQAPFNGAGSNGGNEHLLNEILPLFDAWRSLSYRQCFEGTFLELIFWKGTLR